MWDCLQDGALRAPTSSRQRRSFSCRIIICDPFGPPVGGAKRHSPATIKVSLSKRLGFQKFSHQLLNSRACARPPRAKKMHREKLTFQNVVGPRLQLDAKRLIMGFKDFITDSLHVYLCFRLPIHYTFAFMGATLSSVWTVSTVLRVLIVSRVSTASRVLIVSRVSTVSTFSTVSTVSRVSTCSSVSTVLTFPSVCQELIRNFPQCFAHCLLYKIFVIKNILFNKVSFRAFPFPWNVHIYKW